MGDVKDFVDKKIAGKRVMVFSKKGCPYCTKAKQTFAKYIGPGNLITSDEYEALEIDDNPQCAKIQDYLLEITGGRSVPRIFIDRIFVGGGDDIVEKDKNGQLKVLLSTPHKI